jgi:RNA polymerase sigma factor (sigma-70 family)
VSEDSIQRWVEGANRYPLLSAAQELHLATLVRTWLDATDPTPQQIRAGRRAKERLINGNLRLVVKRAFSFRRIISVRGGDLSDAMQESCLGLNRAAELFDPARGYKFSTYACLWIDQAVRRYLLIGVDTIRRPSAAHDVIRRWRYRREGQTADEFCAHWGLTREKLQTELTQHARADCTSLDKQLLEDGPASNLIDFVADPSSDPTQFALEQEFRERLDQIRAQHPDEMGLLELRANGVKAGELAEMEGVTRDRLRQQLAAARSTLRLALAEPVAAAIVATRRQTVLTIPTPPMQASTNNGHRPVEDLEAAYEAAPAIEEAPAPKTRRRRRSAAELAAAPATPAPAGQITFTVGGIEVSADPASAAALIRQLAAA